MKGGFEPTNGGERSPVAHGAAGADLERMAAMWGLYRRSCSAGAPHIPETDDELRPRFLKEVADRAGIASVRARGARY